LIFQNTPTIEAAAPPPNAIPTEEITRSTEEIRVTKPARRIQQRKHKDQSIPWYKRSPKHLQHIIGDVDKQGDDYIKQKLNSTSPTIQAASDGGHDPESGISTFGWTVAIDNDIIARGRGPAQAHPDLAESFRAEGYGLTSVAIFLRNIIEYLKINPEKCKWTIYTDSKSLIQRIRSFNDYTWVPKWNLRPDEDIARTAYEALKYIPAKLEHIKGHQDTDSNVKELPLPAILNIVADEEATHQRNRMSEPSYRVQNLGTAQLQINEIAITRDSQRWIMRLAGSIPIQQYYKARHSWNETVFESISWQTQVAVLRTYHQEDQARIIKFAHGWLPTQNRKIKEGTAKTTQCRLCGSSTEDNLHLFACNHKVMKKHQDQLVTTIRRWILEHGDSEFSNLIEMAITESCGEKPWVPNLRFISRTWVAGVREQSAIGWKHIFSGRISKTMIKAVDDHYKTEGVHGRKFTGESWAQKFIKQTWDTMLALWKERNAILNHRDIETAKANRKEQLENRVNRCYEFSHYLRHKERLQWFSKSAQELLGQELRHIKAWLTTVERLVRITKREQKQRPRNSIIMEKFLNIQVMNNTKKITAKHKPRRQKQDLHPD
jgi:ribonuclease HI